MEIICPTCNRMYKINEAKLPKGKRVVARCKSCGGKIVIQDQYDIPSVDENAMTVAIERRGTESPSTSESDAQSQGTGQFQFVSESESEEFLGYAGFWKRAAAAVIDMVTLGIIGAFVGGFAGGIYGALTGTPVGTHVLGRAIGILLGWMYYAIMESSKKQATLGKMAVGIKVIDTSGEAVSFARATARHFAKILSAISLGLGYIVVAFTRKKQGFHDMIAGCLVVNSR